MNEIAYIYGLFHPVTGALHYIGKTCRITQRFKAHLSEAKTQPPGRAINDWVRSLLDEGLQPVITVIEECDEAEWSNAERFWVATARDLGLPIVNSCDGGQRGGNFVPEVHARILSASRRGREESRRYMEALGIERAQRKAQDEWLQEESERTGLTKSEIMRRAINYYRNAPANVRSLHKEQ